MPVIRIARVAEATLPGVVTLAVVTFVHPMWLGALLPWVLLTAYLLRRGIAQPIAVPFLTLWHADAQPLLASPQRRSPPPMPIVLLLMALLLAIAALAGPARRDAVVDMTIVLDHGLSMSVRSDVDVLLDWADQHLHAKRVRLMLVPGETIDTDDRGWRALAKQAGPTAIDTAAAVRQAVLTARSHTDGPIIVISDGSIATDARTFLLSPQTSLENVGIATFAIFDGVHPQAMVRLRNRSTTHSGQLTIIGGAAPVTQTINLPPLGEDCDVLVDLPGPLSDTITAKLSAEHTSPLNDRAWAVRALAGPMRWSTLGALPSAMKKMVDVYNRLRPAAASRSAIVQIGNGGDGVWLASAGIADGSTAPVVVPDRLTDDVHVWPAVTNVDAVPPANWHVLVRRGGSTLLAVRLDGRGVWVNADVDAWAASPDFVVFFANVFDAMADGDARWTSELPTGSELPGVYTRDAVRTAVNAPPLPAREKVASNALDHLSGEVAGSITLTPWLMAIASVLGAGAVLIGTKRG